MKNKIQLLLIFISLLLIGSFSSTIYAQGTSDPPVAPVHLNKTATEVPGMANVWDLTLTVRSEEIAVPADVVLVIDKSSSMNENNRLAKAKEAAVQFVQALIPDDPAQQNIQVGLISFDGNVTVLEGLTKNKNSLITKINAITLGSGTFTQGGIHAARNMLKGANSTGVFKHIVLLSDGEATRQYKMRNLNSDTDFLTRYTADPDDVITLDALMFARQDESNANPKANDNSKAVKRGFPESRYDYSQMTNTKLLPNVESNNAVNTRNEYYMPIHAAIDEASFAKADGYVMHTIGYDLGLRLGREGLRLTASTPDHFHTATPEGVAQTMTKIVQTIKSGVKDGVVEDEIARGFHLLNLPEDGDISGLLADGTITISQGSITYDMPTNTLKWDVGTVLSTTLATLKYRVYYDIEEENPEIDETNDMYFTNHIATLDYTNSNNQPDEKEFPKPIVRPGYGAILMNYIPVNAAGQPIDAAGNVTTWRNARQLQASQYLHPTGVEFIAPRYIKVDKNNPNLQLFDLPTPPAEFTIGDKTYKYYEVREGEGENGAVTENKVGISWKKTFSRVYFTYIETVTPTLDPVDIDKTATRVPGEPNVWDLELTITSEEISVPTDVILVIDKSGSMADNERLIKAKAAAVQFVEALIPDDPAQQNVRVGIVTFSNVGANVTLQTLTKDKATLISKINGITAAGQTFTQSGLRTAHTLTGVNGVFKHIVLLSDGEANIQYQIRGLSVPNGDFWGKDDDALVAEAIEYGKTLTAFAVPATNDNSLVVRRGFPESRYIYGQMTHARILPNTSGSNTENPGNRYYMPINAAIDEAQFAKNKGFTVHTIGYDLERNIGKEALKLTATSPGHFHLATPEDVDEAMENIVQSIKAGVTNGVVQDIIAQGFHLVNLPEDGDISGLLADGTITISQGSITYDMETNKLLWDVGTVVSTEPAKLKYRVYYDIEEENPEISDGNGQYYTNHLAELDYIDHNNEEKNKEFPKPTVKPNFGAILMNFVPVNAAGQPIDADGNVTTWINAQKLLNSEYLHPEDVGFIPPRYIELQENNDELQYYVLPQPQEIIKIGTKYYKYTEVKEGEGGEVTNNQVGISWKKTFSRVYFAYVETQNLWIGGNAGGVNDWNIPENWTLNRVPEPGEDVVFATAENNNGVPAQADLHVPADDDKVIGSLINHSDKNLEVVTKSMITIGGSVETPNTGTIVVKASPEEENGTLVFSNPETNANVPATVEFYNKAYDCKDCGFYTRSWQYFGIPVQSSAFPYSTPSVETINQWSEPTNGNKWITPITPLTAFTGYEITNSSKTEPTNIYNFTGTLNVGDANVQLTRTANVNYSGMNLIANSYTAAIPIKEEALQFSSALDNKTVYLFNAGTRDQWRKLNGSTVTHDTQAGQYKAVPINVAGAAGLPSIIPSMHTFMIQANAANTLTIKYDQLTRNTLVDGMAWRSTSSSPQHLPYLVMDVIGIESADRVWLFENPSATRGFDNGWDGHKIIENEIVQVYVSGENEDKYQVGTVSDVVGTEFGLAHQKNENYSISFAVTPDIQGRNLLLYDRVSKRYYPIRDGAEYFIQGRSTLGDVRFKVVSHEAADEAMSSEVQITTQENRIMIVNYTQEECMAYVYDILGKVVLRHHVKPNATEYIDNSAQLPSGVYVVRVANNKSLDVRSRVMLK